LKPNQVGIIGLGRVGMPIAKAYLDAGYNVYGYDLNEDALQQLTSHGGKVSDSPSSVFQNTSTVIVAVLNDQQVLEVVLGTKGLLQSPREGACVICMSTINRSNLEMVADKCQEQNIDFIDCPFTGGPARVPTGNLTLIVAGQPELVEKYASFLKVIGDITLAGDRPGLGQAVKHCNQLLVGVTHAATMEVIRLAQRLSLDTKTVAKVLGDGIAGSDYFKLLSESVLHKTPSPGKLGQMCKDVSIVVNTAKEVELSANVVNAAATYFEAATEKGMHDNEGADLIEVVN